MSDEDEGTLEVSATPAISKAPETPETPEILETTDSETTAKKPRIVYAREFLLSLKPAGTKNSPCYNSIPADLIPQPEAYTGVSAFCFCWSYTVVFRQHEEA
jgi:hypothetical protein